jgi:hypothetical protein
LAGSQFAADIGPETQVITLSTPYTTTAPSIGTQFLNNCAFTGADASSILVFRSDITTDRAFTRQQMSPSGFLLRTSLEMPLGLCRPEHWSRAQQFCPFFSVDWQGTLKPGGSWCPFILHLLCHFISSDGSFELHFIHSSLSGVDDVEPLDA